MFLLNLWDNLSSGNLNNFTVITFDINEISKRKPGNLSHMFIFSLIPYIWKIKFYTFCKEEMIIFQIENDLSFSQNILKQLDLPWYATNLLFLETETSFGVPES